MERIKTLKTLVTILAVILVIELGMLVIMIKPTGFFMLSTLFIIIIVLMFLLKLCYTLLKEIKDKTER